MNKLFEYRCYEYIKVTKGHSLSMWGMEGDTDEENSQGNKLALKQMSLRKAIRVHSPFCFQRKKYQIMKSQPELVGQLRQTQHSGLSKHWCAAASCVSDYFLPSLLLLCLSFQV